MREEIVTLIDQATESMNELENYLFNNLKEKYIVSKNILDYHKEHIEEIRGILNLEAAPEDYENAKSDLTFIIETIKNGRDELTAHESETETGVDAFSEKDIDDLLKALDTAEMETVLPSEDVFPESVENTLEALESEAANKEETPVVDDLEEARNWFKAPEETAKATEEVELPAMSELEEARNWFKAPEEVAPVETVQNETPEVDDLEEARNWFKAPEETVQEEVKENTPVVDELEEARNWFKAPEEVAPVETVQNETPEVDDLEAARNWFKAPTEVAEEVKNETPAMDDLEEARNWFKAPEEVAPVETVKEDEIPEVDDLEEARNWFKAPTETTAEVKDEIPAMDGLEEARNWFKAPEESVQEEVNYSEDLDVGAIEDFLNNSDTEVTDEDTSASDAFRL